MEFTKEELDLLSALVYGVEPNVWPCRSTLLEKLKIMKSTVNIPNESDE